MNLLTFTLLITFRSTDEIYGFSNVPLAEAARQRSLPLVDLLLKFGAKDEQSIALCLACSQESEVILCKLLSTRAHPDPEYKINKKALTTETELAGIKLPSFSNLTYSQLFPNTAIMINWHNNNNCQLQKINVKWLSEAVLQYNPKLKEHPRSNYLALGALTRIDLSHNSLTELPPEIFNMCSLRYLNVAQNKLQFLPGPSDTEQLSPLKSLRKNIIATFSSKATDKKMDYECLVLEELFVQDNRLECLPPSIFRLPSLVTLDVSNNKLQELPFEMWRAPKLKELNVAFNLLKDLPTLSEVSFSFNFGG